MEWGVDRKYVCSEFLKAAAGGRFQPTDRQREYMIALYDDGIRMVDHYLKEFFDWLKVVGVYDRSLIIVTSDHGEEFGDHGSYLHEQIYEEVCRIPLLMKFPQQAFGGRARCVFESSSERIEGQRSKGQHILDGSKDFRHFNPV